MYLNKFSARINGKMEDSGYVEMKHGETYVIVLKNDNNVRCDATVEIDGKDVGTFRIDAKSNIRLERPANESKLFTFYQLGTSEATKSGLGKVDKNDMGLIRVIFKPEKVYYEPVILKQVVLPRTPTITWEHHTLNENYVDDCEQVWGVDSVDYYGSSSNNSSYYSNSTTLNYSESPIRYRSFGKSKNSYQDSDILPKAGGTGLSGHSSQKFINVQDLDYDESRITEIYLRLIPVKESRMDPTELKPVIRSTPIPPVLFVFI